MIHRSLSRVALSAVVLMAPALRGQEGAPANPNAWTISALDSFANFTVKHLMVSTVHGSMGGMKGTVVYDPKDPSKDSVDATLDVSTFNTGIAKRDDQVRNDFFGVQKFPVIAFKSTKVVKAGAGKLTMSGNLTIKGVTRPVTLAVVGPSQVVKDAQGRSKVGLTATTKISRKAFGIVDAALDGVVEAGGLIVSDEVSIELDIEMTPGTVAPPTGPAVKGK